MSAIKTTNNSYMVYGIVNISNTFTVRRITYDEDGRSLFFAGDNLLYRQDKSQVIIKGSDGNPCFVNGARADNIRLNTKNGSWKTNVAGPGAIQGSGRRNWWRK